MVYNEQTKEALNREQTQNPDKKFFWRVSSTLFGHVRTDRHLEVLEKYKNEENIQKYPKIKVDD